MFDVGVKTLSKKTLLADDVKQMIIETDEENPVTIANIGDDVNLADGYRVRVILENQN
jgi:hypothetical protein